MSMSVTEAQELAARIRKEADDKVSASPAKTNGEGRVHLRYERTSETLTRVSEWDDHPLNRKNAPRKPRKKKGARSDEADAATVEQGLSTVYNPED
jgi:hypothetical protein